MRSWLICGIAVVGWTVAGCSDSGAPSNFSGDYGANAAANSKPDEPKGNDADAMAPPPVPEYVPAGGNANKSGGTNPATNNPPKAADPAANPSSTTEGSDAGKSEEGKSEEGKTDAGKSDTSAAPQESANSGNAPAAVGGTSVDDLAPPPVPGVVNNGANASTNQFTNPTRPAQGAGGGKLGMLNPGAAQTGGGGTEPGSDPTASSGDSVAAEKESFLQKAQTSFQKFDESIGERYLYAHWLVDDKAKDEFPLEWVGGLKEPRLFVRWGVAVALDVPADYSGSIPFIGSGTNSSNLNPSGGGGRPGNDARRGIALDAPPPAGGGGGNVGGGSVPGDRTSPQASLRYCTGDFGSRLVKRFEMRRDSSPSYFGKILGQVTDGNVTAVRNAAPTNTGGRLGMVDPDGAAPPVPGANSPAAQATARSQWQSPDDRFAAGTLIPGVYFLGVDDGKSEKQFVEAAKQMGLDALIVFKVDVNSRRSGSATSTTSAVVHNLKNDESQKTSSLNNESVAKAREKSKGAEDDPVEGELDKLFANFSDVHLKTGEMPALTADMVSNRVAKIATDSQPLAAIVEVVNYWRAGLLDAAVAEDFVAKATDAATAKTLLSGTDEERIQALEKWLDQYEEPVTQGSGSFR